MISGLFRLIPKEALREKGDNVPCYFATVAESEGIAYIYARLPIFYGPRIGTSWKDASY